MARGTGTQTQTAGNGAQGIKSLLNPDALMRLTLFIVIVILWAGLAIASPYFLTAGNLYNLVRQTAVAGIIALGETFVIIAAGIDLSVGSTVAMVGVVTALAVTSGIPVFLAILMALALGLAIGIIQGLIFDRGGIPPFIVTLGGMSVLRGLALIISGGRNIAGLPRSFRNFANGDIFGLPNLFVVFLVIAVISWFILHRSKWGRYIFAVGSNAEAARLSGISLTKVRVLVYGISGLFAAVGGLLLTSRLAMGMPTAGNMYELDAIAASVVGGASLFGAEGSVVGTFIGAFLISTIWNGTNLLNVDPFWQRVLVGLLIVLIVYIDQRRKRNQA